MFSFFSDVKKKEMDESCWARNEHFRVHVIPFRTSEPHIFTASASIAPILHPPVLAQPGDIEHALALTHFACIADTLLAVLPTQNFLHSLVFSHTRLVYDRSYPFHTIPVIWTASNRQVLTSLCPRRVRTLIPFAPFVSHQIYLLHSVDRLNFFLCI